MLRKTIAMAVFILALVIGTRTVLAGSFLIDLTHPIPTFKPMGADPLKPDTSQPWLDSKPIPTFGQQTVLSISQFPTNQGHFDIGLLVIAEHHGTHMDTATHYVNNPESKVLILPRTLTSTVLTTPA